MDGQDMQDKSEWGLLFLWTRSADITKSSSDTYLSHAIAIPAHNVIPSNQLRTVAVISVRNGCLVLDREGEVLCIKT
jgi:hypothetical protein